MEPELWILIAVLVAVFGVLPWLLNVRKRRRRAVGLSDFAGQIGGRYIDAPDAAVPRSAAVHPPFKHRMRADDVGERLAVASPPRYQYAIDVPRGRWHARVAQATMSAYSSTGPHGQTTELAERRVEIATPAIAPMKIAPVLTRGTYRGIIPKEPENGERYVFGEPELHEPPGQTPWHPVRLPAGYDAHLRVYSADPRVAAAALTETVLRWLLQHGDRFQDLVYVDRGLAYLVRPFPIRTELLLAEIDFLAGFLDRIPPQAWAGPAGS